MAARTNAPAQRSDRVSRLEEAGSSSSASSSRSGSYGEGEEDYEQEEQEQEQEGAPKFAQYIDSDEAEEDASDDDEEELSESEEESIGEDAEMNGRSDLLHREDAISKKLGSIPFATLARARNAVRRDEAGEETSDSEEDEFAEERARKEGESDEKKTKKKDRVASQHDLQKRSNKHAPTEMSTRKPVSRRRNVVEGAIGANPNSRRDPRFSSLSASAPNADLFRSSYGFLREKQGSEVAELKSVYNKLKRQEANHAGSKARSELALSIREEKEKVEMALKRAEGQENERRRRERENHVIQREKKAIQERVKQGGKVFHLKESAKKQLILKDKFDRLSNATEDDNKGASSRKDLKRAIERRRKKNAAKERREMPIGEVSSARAIPKRKRLANDLAVGVDRKRDRRG